MADILYYKTVTGSEGSHSVSTGGLSSGQIIKVARQGEQKDKSPLVPVSSLNGSNWMYIPHTKRIEFGTSFPFAAGGEVIYIMYKVSI